MPARGRSLSETRWMNCEVSSIQPESSTAPACRNISQGERAWRAPAASAAAREPLTGRKRQPATSATRSITPVPARSTRRTSLDHAGGSARHQRGEGGDGGLFDAFSGNNDAQHGRCFGPADRENAARLSPCHNQSSLAGCSFLRQLRLIALPAAVSRRLRWQMPRAIEACDRLSTLLSANVLDLFYRRAMFSP